VVHTALAAKLPGRVSAMGAFFKKRMGDRMKRKYLISAVLCVCLALFIVAAAACGGGKAPQTLKVGIMPDFDSIPFVVAKQKGYLPEEVELVIFMSPMDRDAALFARELDGTISDVLAVCQAKDGGFDLAIASGTNGCYGLLSAAPVSSGKELHGKQIGLSLNTIIEYTTDRILEAGGGDPALVEKVSVPKIPSRLELLGNGQLDAIAVPEPYVTAAAAQGGYLISTSAELDINPGVLLFTREALQEKSAEIESFFTAYDKAVDYIQANRAADFMPAVAEELGLPEEALNAELPAYTHAGMPAESEVLKAMEWLREKGMLRHDYTYEELLWR
jgi:NitT/TauT family transport system substrate-binding protein